MAAETEKELQQLQKRFLDLADRSWKQNLFTFSGFLSLAEQDCLCRALGLGRERSDGRKSVQSEDLLREASGGFNGKSGEFKGKSEECSIEWVRTDLALFGGTPHAQRVMARFGDPAQLGYEEPFPIACVRIEPLQEKFSDALTHRDFLGAILNLGIDRSAIGDIFVDGKCAYVFCTAAMCPFLRENLEQVRHTRVKCREVTEVSELPEPKREEREVSVASPRCDSVVAAVWKLSRGQSQALFPQKKVYVGGRQQENDSYLLREGDTVSVRGCGKFLYMGEKYKTRKGKLVVGVTVFL